MTDSAGPDLQPTRRSGASEVRIRTGSRLHFGLLDTVDPFGGIGVIIETPPTELRVETADRFSSDDREEPRFRAIARRIQTAARLAELPACRISVSHRPPAHCGLGSGTQLAMSAAEAMCQFVGWCPEPGELAHSIADRGKRSAVGVHGYLSGGMIFESAKRPSDLNPLRERVELPSHWCVAVVRPAQSVAMVSGSHERAQFVRLPPASSQASVRLREEILERMLPAARSGDFEAFCDSVQHYNRCSGQLFEAVQGGPYNGAAVEDVVNRLVKLGAQGVGQSSWGPGVFAWFRNRAKAVEFCDSLPDHLSLIAIASPRNHPRELSASASPMSPDFGPSHPTQTQT